MTDEDVRKGDWVRFYQNEKLVIGEVNYVIKDITSYLKVCTDVGQVCLESILERRREQ